MSPSETDFVSIDSNTDVDFFSFTIGSPALLDVTLTPLGGVFSQGVEGGTQSSFDANARNDLSLAVFASNGTTLLGSANLTGAGQAEVLSDLQLTTAGTYFARVTGASTNVQLYQLQLSAMAASISLAGRLQSRRRGGRRRLRCVAEHARPVGRRPGRRRQRQRDD